MLSEFSKPKAIVCLLCQAWVSVRKGDKTRFFQHVSSDHEVHFDLELLFSLSSLQQTQKRSVVATINSLLKTTISDAACDELLLTDSEDATESAESSKAVEASDVVDSVSSERERNELGLRECGMGDVDGGLLQC